jgi:2-amino-4-hydroxy-6-hydroxymethyldihydropteridine diphosphokinase
MASAWISIGSNQGDRLGHITKALRLMGGLRDTELGLVSPVYDTAPVGKTDQPRFLNVVAELRTELAPRPLLHELLAIEDVCGRFRREVWGPRTLDLDIIAYDGVEMETGALTLPHPRARERAFVLVPLADVAPSLELPGAGATVAEMVKRLGDIGDQVTRVGDPPAPGTDPE